MFYLSNIVKKLFFVGILIWFGALAVKISPGTCPIKKILA